ncbi:MULTISPECIES: hypothetical protein [unclassified Nocardioides]|uniref:hypothetical protein n=1 Tax=unclassified Nocardioides TaxID=2615069 RepID=UPI0006F74962|nr:MULTISPECIES: hypothetical protein [unclassified Nocardioides]KRA29980.1 hypothetical protein ASD81_20010 [Nocardioides sp. Root614]KRA86901.1 hypothetical protein ASD84_22225 [Nocardioides sp. Root682]
MDNDKTRQSALDEYHRIVALFGEWYDRDTRLERTALEAELGRTIDVAAHHNEATATRVVFDEVLVEVIAEAFAAGIPRWMIVEFRGWVSHNDLRDLMGRARRPYRLDLEREWVQYRTLVSVQQDARRLATTDPAAADRLLRAARTLLKRWVREVPKTPPTEYLKQFASGFHADHRREWVDARRRLAEQVDQLGQTEVTK